MSTPKKKQGKKRSIDPDFVPIEKDDVISSETETDDDSEDPNILDTSSKKIVSSRGLLSKRKDDDQKLKRSRQSQNIYMNEPKWSLDLVFKILSSKTLHFAEQSARLDSKSPCSADLPSSTDCGDC